MVKLTVELAEKYISNLICLAEADSEQAHIQEDELREWFIECVAAGMYDKEEAIQVASIVMKTKDIKFRRYYA